MSRDLDSISYCSLFLEVVEEFGTKFLLRYENSAKTLCVNLHKLLIKVLETKKVYVDMSTITSKQIQSRKWGEDSVLGVAHHSI